jgi:hypothetical protein
MESYYYTKNNNKKDKIKQKFYKNGFTFLNDLLLCHYVDNELDNENIDLYKTLVNITSEDVLIKIRIIEIYDVNKLTEFDKLINFEDFELYGNISNNNDLAIYNQHLNVKFDNDLNHFSVVYNNKYINNNYNPLSCMISIILEWKDHFECNSWNKNRKKLYAD